MRHRHTPGCTGVNQNKGGGKGQLRDPERVIALASRKAAKSNMPNASMKKPYGVVSSLLTILRRQLIECSPLNQHKSPEAT